MERVVRSALDEDLALGPDVTTERDRPAGRDGHRRRRPPDAGRARRGRRGRSVFDLVGGRGVELELLADDGAAPARRCGARGDRPDAGAAHGRAHRPQPDRPPVRNRHADRQWVDAVAGTGAAIRDTRKTTPGLRALEKYAVRAAAASTTAWPWATPL